MTKLKKKVTAKKVEAQGRTDKAWLVTQDRSLRDSDDNQIASINEDGEMSIHVCYLDRDDALRLAAWIKEWFE